MAIPGSPVLAAAVGPSDHRADALHPRSGCGAFVDPPAQCDVQQPPIGADVSNARDARQERDEGIALAGRQLRFRGLVNGRDARELEVADQVAVRIDQPGQDGEPGEIDPPNRPGLGPGFVGSQNSCNDTVPNEDGTALACLAGRGIKQPAGIDEREISGHGRSVPD